MLNGKGITGRLLDGCCCGGGGCSCYVVFWSWCWCCCVSFVWTARTLPTTLMPTHIHSCTHDISPNIASVSYSRCSCCRGLSLLLLLLGCVVCLNACRTHLHTPFRPALLQIAWASRPRTHHRGPFLLWLLLFSTMVVIFCFAAALFFFVWPARTLPHNPNRDRTARTALEKRYSTSCEVIFATVYRT